jgi:hypothetical protein
MMVIVLIEDRSVWAELGVGQWVWLTEVQWVGLTEVGLMMVIEDRSVWAELGVGQCVGLTEVQWVGLTEVGLMIVSEDWSCWAEPGAASSWWLDDIAGEPQRENRQSTIENQVSLQQNSWKEHSKGQYSADTELNALCDL